MNADFFASKRPWSKYKDSILRYYLTPYIAKVSKLRKPILIVDCFAGCGRFGDGEAGSPIIIGDAIKNWRNKGSNVSGFFIESDPDNFESLESALNDYGKIGSPRFGTFEEHIDELAQRAASETIFLYVDPYAVRNLKFDRMKKVYDQIQLSGASVEVLMNLNVAIFMRWALAALKRVDDLPSDPTSDGADFLADDPDERVELCTLDEIAGGDFWRGIASDESLTFANKLDRFTEDYAARLRSSFDYVCTYAVKSKYEHQTPKYMLIHATRHPDGLELMNDAMCNARMEFLGAEFAKDRLFEMTPENEQPDVTELKKLVLAFVAQASTTTRKEIRLEVLRCLFCRYPKKIIDRTVSDLLKARKLYSGNGQSRVNDSVQISIRSFK
jgi:three-Cys-motif partner protein